MKRIDSRFGLAVFNAASADPPVTCHCRVPSVDW